LIKKGLNTLPGPQSLSFILWSHTEIFCSLLFSHHLKVPEGFSRNVQISTCDHVQFCLLMIGRPGTVLYPRVKPAYFSGFQKNESCQPL
jgi:hypothetical protein